MAELDRSSYANPHSPPVAGQRLGPAWQYDARRTKYAG